MTAVASVFARQSALTGCFAMCQLPAGEARIKQSGLVMQRYPSIEVLEKV